MASNRRILQALLSKHGDVKEVHTAENGQEAVQAALANPRKFDIVLMDNLMPIMVPRATQTSNVMFPCKHVYDFACYQSGVEAVRTLRDAGYVQLVVGVTGNILDEDVDDYLVAGADMVMGKPVKMALLKKLLCFVKEHGAVSRPGMQLTEERGGKHLTWKLNGRDSVESKNRFC